MLRLHAMQWEGRGVTPEHLLPRFRAHLERAVGELARNGDALVTEYRLGDETVAAEISLASPDMVCGYLYGADPRLRDEKVDITTMLLRNNAAFADSSGRATLNLMRGAEPHKLRWQAESVANQRFVLSRRQLAPALGLHTAQIAGRAFAAEMVRQRAAGGWSWRGRPIGGKPGSDGTAG